MDEHKALEPGTKSVSANYTDTVTSAYIDSLMVKTEPDLDQIDKHDEEDGEDNITDQALMDMQSVVDIKPEPYAEEVNASDVKVEEFMDETNDTDNETDDTFPGPSADGKNAKKHACEICRKRFSRAYDVKRHMLTHTGVKPYACNICDRRFTRSCDVKKHMLTHTGEKPHVCNTCGKRFGRFGDLKRHMLTHTSTSAGQITYEKQDFAMDSNMKSGKVDDSNKEDPEIFSSSYIDKLMGKSETDVVEERKVENMTDHDPLNHDQLNMNCDAKALLTSDTEDNNEMKETVNDNEREVDDSTVQKHDRLATNTSEEKKHFCEYCGKRFSRSFDMKRHIMTHTGERRYPCEFCDMRFIRAEDLKRHMLKHTGEKPHACQLCESRFGRFADLKIHMLLHTGEKPHECDTCKKRFRNMSNLRKHTLTHTGEKPHQCGICNLRFTRLGSLKRHMTLHDKEESL